VLHDTKAELGRRLEVARKAERQAATEAFRPAYDAAKSAFLDAVLTLAAAWGELHAMDRHAQALDGLGPLRGMADLRDALRQVVNRWMCTPGGLSPGQQERAAAVLGELHS